MARTNSFLASGIILLTILGAASFTAVAHPGSGIVIDAQGNIFFQDSAARTIWKIDPHGKVTAHHDKLGGHWMALDAKGKFARAGLKLVEWVAPALIVADGGAPISVNTDGNLYYGLGVSSTGQASVGITRIFPDGKQEPFAPDFAGHIEKLGITGLASGPDGTLYVACLTGVLKVKTDGTFTTLANPVVMKDCDQDAPTSFLRGLDVDSHGTVYAAASGCRSVVKITAEGKVETVLKAERPWSPTGIAVQGDDVYVLEYTNANGHLSEGWLPRVRKLGRDGKVTTLATISKEQQSAQPNRQILLRRRDTRVSRQQSADHIHKTQSRL
jgi:sugar lactone lactonase YvrE